VSLITQVLSKINDLSIYIRTYGYMEWDVEHILALKRQNKENPMQSINYIGFRLTA